MKHNVLPKKNQNPALCFVDTGLCWILLSKLLDVVFFLQNLLFSEQASLHLWRRWTVAGRCRQILCL